MGLRGYSCPGYWIEPWRCQCYFRHLGSDLIASVTQHVCSLQNTIGQTSVSFIQFALSESASFISPCEKLQPRYLFDRNAMVTRCLYLAETALSFQAKHSHCFHAPNDILLYSLHESLSEWQRVSQKVLSTT